jgi:hypothetical protein
MHFALGAPVSQEKNNSGLKLDSITKKPNYDRFSKLTKPAKPAKPSQKPKSKKWLDEKLESIQVSVRLLTKGGSHPSAKRKAKATKEHDDELVVALKGIYAVSRAVLKDKNKALFDTLCKRIGLMYRQEGWRAPRRGTNPFGPLVRYCFPDATASNRDRYTGLIAMAVYETWPVKEFAEKYELAAEEYKVAGMHDQTRFTMKQLGRSYKELITERYASLSFFDGQFMPMKSKGISKQAVTGKSVRPPVQRNPPLKRVTNLR